MSSGFKKDLLLILLSAVFLTVFCYVEIFSREEVGEGLWYVLGYFALMPVLMYFDTFNFSDYFSYKTYLIVGMIFYLFEVFFF